jgi:hypothetical protein
MIGQITVTSASASNSSQSTYANLTNFTALDSDGGIVALSAIGIVILAGLMIILAKPR